MDYADSAADILAIMKRFHGQETGADYEHHKRTIARYIEKGEPIHCIIPAFPGKSINPDSVFSGEPDKGDLMGVQTLIRLQEEISEVYAPGCKIAIFHDGHFFRNTGCARSFEEMDAYVERIKEETKGKGFRSYTIGDFYAETTYEEMLETFYLERIPSQDALRACIAGSDRAKSDLTHKICFVYNEFAPVLWPYASNTKKQVNSKKTAYEFMAIEKGISSLIADKFPDYVRLSIHQQDDPASKKFFINLLPLCDGRSTPWFHVLLEKNGAYSLVKKKDIIGAEACLDETGAVYMKAKEGKTVIKTEPVEAMHGNEYSYTEPQMLEAIRRGMPSEASLSDIVFNHRGWTSVIAEIDQKWIAKFPRSNAAYNHLLKEHRALNAIRSHLDFAIPKRALADASPPFFFHEKLNGEHFSYEDYCKASAEQKETFVNSVADVMAQINEVPIAKMAGLVPAMKYELPDEEGLCSTLSQAFTPWELTQARKIMDRFRKVEQRDEFQRVGLFDFHGYNVVVDPASKKITGVFDFDELAIGDLHFCLREARLHYGDEVGEKVCKRYEVITGEPVDRERLDICFKGWYLFEQARYMRNQEKLKDVSFVGADKHAKRIRAFLHEEGNAQQASKPFKPKRRDLL